MQEVSDDEPGSLIRIKKFSDSEEEESVADAEIEENEEETLEQKNGVKSKKIRKKGIIYIGSIPQHMNVAICRELMEQFGEVGRIFLQPDRKGSEF